MGRKSAISDDALLERLGDVFRDAGFEGASMAALSEATGLKKASLYHRFPGGKEQMARETLDFVSGRFLEAATEALNQTGSPRARLDALAAAARDFYAGGRKACLLNALASGDGADAPFNAAIGRAFVRLQSAIAGVLQEAGADAETAERRAEKALALIEGGLVLARGKGDVRAFTRILDDLSGDLLAGF